MNKEDIEKLSNASERQSLSIYEIDEFLKARPSPMVPGSDPRRVAIRHTISVLRERLEHTLLEVEEHLLREFREPYCGTADDELWPIRTLRDHLEYVKDILQSVLNSHKDFDHEISTILKAAYFAAEKHKMQRRKGADASPYINHPLKVAEVLWRVGEVRDVDYIVAALLHDTIEDTATTPSELEVIFGTRVRSLIEEVSDDKSLAKEERKGRQIANASSLSPGAKQIKLADKIANIFDVAFAPASDWTIARREEYLIWAEKVAIGLRGYNPKLDANFDEVLKEAREQLRRSEELGQNSLK